MHFLSGHSLKWSVYFDDQQVKSSQTFKVGQIQNKQNKGCKKAKFFMFEFSNHYRKIDFKEKKLFESIWVCHLINTSYFLIDLN